MRLAAWVAPWSVIGSVLLLAGCGAAPDDEPEGSSGDELRTCAAGTTVKGIDVSYYQGTVDWNAVRASGRVFAFARVSDGTTKRDPKFAQNWAGMASAGLVRGAYQYFRPNQSAVAQADLFLDAVGTLGAEDLPPVLDVETASGLSATAVRTAIKTWIDRVEARSGRRVIIYTAAFMSPTIGTSFTAQPLWVANFGATCPSMPTGWTDWKFFQSSETGTVPGVTGNVDLDVFNGSLAALRAFATESRIGGGAPVPSDPADDGAAPATPAPGGTDTTGGGCYSATLSSDMPPLACVESAYDGGGWFQCYEGQWYRGGDATSGPYGACSSSTPR